MVDLSKEFKDIQSIVKDGTSQNKVKQTIAKHEAQEKIYFIFNVIFSLTVNITYGSFI